MLSCGEMNHADFSKRKYLNLPKFSHKNENTEVVQNSIVTSANDIVSIDAIQKSNFENKVELSVSIEEEETAEKITRLVEPASYQPFPESNMNESFLDNPDTNKSENSDDEVAEDPEPISDNPDLDVFHKHANFAFWLVLIGLGLVVASVPLIFSSVAFLYFLTVVLAAISLLAGWVLSIMNVRLAKKIPREERTGVFNLKLGFSWVVSVVGVLILAGLAVLLAFQL